MIKSYRLLSSHEFESLKVSQVGLDLSADELLSPAGLGPFLLELGLDQSLLQRLLASTVWDSNTEFGEVQWLDVHDLTTNTGGWAVNQSLGKKNNNKKKRESGTLEASVSGKCAAKTVVFTYSVDINNINDGAELALFWTKGNEADASDLNQFLSNLLHWWRKRKREKD